MAIQSSGPTRKRPGLTRTQVLIVVALGVGNCLVFGILAWVLYSATATSPASLPVEQQAAEATATPIPSGRAGPSSMPCTSRSPRRP